ncbi:PQQ-binding-like beta-propeller repeat protein [Parvibaculum sp.]|jgi:outer membrane protein assembly factor BamB|uniref:PQQ-like beta-propeller repeat protein n=1 Tax=Parvibaculum sp. TaxID=2024848 RepID=UPI0025DA42C2|nr:PQQ-binding-like beta-propeller repeat protein [Parvibaculum sp.]|tara:strand:- start:8136 stop:9512 length:1377 start_codon:yes stop_codon:yes gene_type:complete
MAMTAEFMSVAARKSGTLLRVAMVALAFGTLAGCDSVTGMFTSEDKTVLPGKRLSVMELGSTLEVDPAIADELVILPQPYVNPDWPQPGGSPDNANYHLAAPGPLDRLWSVDAGAGSDRVAQLTASPVIADGKIFVLDAESTVRAFDRKTGKRLWETDLVPEGEDADEGRGGGVAFDNGKIFVVTGFGTGHGLDAASGAIVWTQTLGEPFRAAPTANGGRVFAVTADNQTIAFAQETGEVLWRHRGIVESAGILSSPSPAVAGSVVISPYSSGELVALRVANGTPVWSDSLNRTGRLTSLSELNDIAGRPVIDRDRVFAISHSGRMVSIDLRTGERAWTRDIGGVQTPWVAGDYLYLITNSEELVAISRRDGRIRWITPMPRWEDPEDREDPIVWSGPVLVSDRLILVSSTGDATSVSPYTGEILGRIDLPDDVLIAPVVADETLYILTDSASLIALK